MHRVFIALAHLLAVSMPLVQTKVHSTLEVTPSRRRSAKFTPRCESIVSKKAKNYVEDLLRSLHGLQSGSNFK